MINNIFKFSGQNCSGSLDQTLEQYGAYEVIDYIVQHLSRHPFLAFGMSMCVLSCALPFIIFMVFAIATVIMTFTGFVIIEGQIFFLNNFKIIQLKNFKLIKSIIVVIFPLSDRHINHISISIVVRIFGCCHSILFILRFCHDGRILWVSANLRVGRLSQQTSCVCSIFPRTANNKTS